MKLKKILTLMCCAVLLVCISVGATLAYLQDDTDVVTNTFTTGKVEIDLDEAAVEEYGTKIADADRVKKNQYKLIPGHNYVKDPTIHVAVKSEESFLFVEVANGLANAEAAGEKGTIATQMETNGWTLLSGNVYYYNAKVDAREEAKDVVVFEEFTLLDNVDVEEYLNTEITIKAYAVQADGFADAAAAWAATYGAPAAN